ncbi:hypothetical protein LIER_20843 [Lithospermum erythrorhizon]|uniref:Uncharacterized protein n=1 Tax=Lithospermum erythrorhizon TaxID=34254 RepID=A0AAV3QRE4_LITER
MTIGDCFGKLQPLWDELATYDPIPLCLCGFCLCDLGEKFQLKQDNDRFHEFLFGIHVDRFGALRSSLLSQDPPPTLDRAYHVMLQEEQLQSKRGVFIDRDSIMAAQAPSRGKVDSRTKAWPCTASLLPELVCFELQCKGVAVRNGVAKVEDHVERFGCWGRGSSHGSSPNASISSPPPNNIPEACFDDENSSDTSEVESQVEIVCDGSLVGSGVSPPSSVPVGAVPPKTSEQLASLDADVPSAAVSDDG